MGTTRLSVPVFSAVLILAAGSAAHAATQIDPGRCRASNPDARTAGCIDVSQGGGATAQSRAFAYGMQGSVHSYEVDRPVGDFVEIVRLDPNGPRVSRNRGVRQQTRTDLERAIARYSKIIMLDPEEDDAYFRRGIAHFYAGSLAKAVADISQASELDPKYPYYALWLDIVGHRGNLTSRLEQASAHIDMTKWPAPVIRLFLGRTTEAAVFAAAQDSKANIKASQVCEANFYIGELALRRNEKEEAARLFRRAAADCPHDLVEMPAAYAELMALSADP